MRKRKYKYFAFACVLVCVYYFFGVQDYVFSKSFENFDYPLSIDIKPIVQEVMAGLKPSVTPINYYPYRYLTNSGKCNTIEKLDLFVVVKSAMENFGHRAAIRQTYGQNNIVPGRIIKMLFFLGTDGVAKSNLQRKINEEMATYKDIIQMDFHDNYFNNTIKTMMSFRWVYEHCSSADYYLFTDDDMYISLKNLFEYLHDLNEEFMNGNSQSSTGPFDNSNEDQINLSTNVMSERDRQLFAGYVFKSIPQRFRSSKWRVSLQEYPWNRWPAYVTAGAYVLSNKSMRTLYIGSLFVKHFRFDDIYLGIVAKKVGITPTHCPMFHFYRKTYDKDGYRKVIASHGYSDHDELIRVWKEQNDISKRT